MHITVYCVYVCAIECTKVSVSNSGRTELLECSKRCFNAFLDISNEVHAS